MNKDPWAELVTPHKERQAMEETPFDPAATQGDVTTIATMINGLVVEIVGEVVEGGKVCFSDIKDELRTQVVGRLDDQMNNQSAAARRLNMNRGTYRKFLKRYHERGENK